MEGSEFDSRAQSGPVCYSVAMPRKRPPDKPARGSGSLYVRAQDGRLVLKATVHAHDHTAKTVYLYGDSEAELRERLANLRADARNPPAPPAPEPLTVERYLRQWLAGRHDLSPGARHSYAGNLRRYVYPALGAVLLADLTPQHLRDLWAVLAVRLKASSIAPIHAVLHKALADAVYEGLLTANPADRARKPRVTKHEAQTLSVEAARQLLDALSSHRLRALYLLALHTAMRRGELAGLLWRDVDLDGGTLTVRRQLQTLPRQPKTLQETKTRRVHTIPLTRQAADALRAHRQRQREERLAAGSAWQDTGCVFTTASGGYLRLSTLDDILRRTLRRAELPAARLHDLRHSTGSLLLAEGLDPAAVAALLSHSSPRLTLEIYSHATGTAQRRTREALERLFGTEG